MKRFIAFLALTVVAVTAWAAIHFARGQGVVEGGSWAGAHFEFRITQPQDPAYPNRFRFWDHGMLIPVDIVVPHPDRIAFERNVVHFSGRGLYNETTHVRVFVTAVDGGPHHHDCFRMVARDQTGTIVHSAEGEVIEGGILIGHRH
jgi:hypothetical protein